MEENNDIFLTGGDALVYLAEPMHKKFSTKFVWRYPFSTYLSYDRSFNLRPLYAPVHIFDDPPPFHSPVVYLIDGLFLNRLFLKSSQKLNHCFVTTQPQFSKVASNWGLFSFKR